MFRARRRTSEDFQQEIEAHLAAETDRLIAEGLTPEQARAAALRSFGNMTHAEERFYESSRVMWLHDASRDLRHGLRSLLRNRVFALVALLTLAIGIGSTAAATPPSPPSPPPTAAPASAAPVPTPPPKPIAVVDVVAQLEKRAAANPQKLNWRTSIVDLLKLLDIDSTFAARKELAVELGCPGELMGDSAKMNIWLHKAVLSRIAANGGNVPRDLLD